MGVFNDRLVFMYRAMLCENVGLINLYIYIYYLCAYISAVKIDPKTRFVFSARNLQSFFAGLYLNLMNYCVILSNRYRSFERSGLEINPKFFVAGFRKTVSLRN